jgi:hypothetical protein
LDSPLDVGDCLRSLGLGQNEAVFRDNGVDGAVLPKLTVDDIKEIGGRGRWPSTQNHCRDRGIERFEDASIGAGAALLIPESGPR